MHGKRVPRIMRGRTCNVRALAGSVPSAPDSLLARELAGEDQICRFRTEAGQMGR